MRIIAVHFKGLATGHPSDFRRRGLWFEGGEERQLEGGENRDLGHGWFGEESSRCAGRGMTGSSQGIQAKGR